MKNFKRILGLVTVLIAVGILSMMAFADTSEVTADLEEPAAQAAVVETDDDFVCTGECTGECDGEGPVQARDGSGTGLQKRLGNGEGNGQGLCNGEGPRSGEGNGSGYRGGRK